MLLHPAPETSQQQLQLLDLLSQTRTALLVTLPGHTRELVLCPEGGSSSGDLAVAALLMKHHEAHHKQQQQQQVVLKQEPADEAP